MFVVGITVEAPPPPPSPDVATIGIGMDGKTYVDSTEKRTIYVYCPLEGLDDTPTWLANGSIIQQGTRYTVTREYLRIEKLPFGCTTYQCKITFASYSYAESSTVCVRGMRMHCAMCNLFDENPPLNRFFRPEKPDHFWSFQGA